MLLFLARQAQANIYEWTTTPVGYVIQSSTLCPSGAGVSAAPVRNLSGLDLTQAYLAYTNLSGALLVGTTLTNANASAGTLTNVNLTGANLTNATLTGSILINANLTGANLSNAYLAGAVLTNANLSNAQVSNASFSASTLTSSQLYSTASYEAGNLQGIAIADNNLNGWNFFGQDLTNASLSYGTLTNVELSNATVVGADFAASGLTSSQLYSTASYQAGNLQGIVLRNNNLSGWNLSGQNLTNANLFYTSLTNANLSGATVTGVNFGASTLTSSQLYSTASYQAGNLQGIVLDSTDISGWDLSGQNLSSAQLSDGTLSNANLTRANLTNAYLSTANLINVNLSNAIVAGANFDSTKLTSSQLYSTASYQAGNLRGISLGKDNLSGWNLSGQNLSNAYLADGNLADVDLTGADLRGAFLVSASLSGAITANTILANGTVQGLTLNSTSPGFMVGNYSGSQSIPINILQGMSMTQSSSLVIAFDGNPWRSTISFAQGIPVTLGGSLVLGLAPGASSPGVFAGTIQLFNWTGVTPSGQFNVVDNLANNYLLDTSQLYTTGNIFAVSHAIPGLSVSSSNQVVIVGATVQLSLSNGTQGQSSLASLDVNSLGPNVTGPTGGALIASGSSQCYTGTVNPPRFGSQTQTFSLNVGDDHTLLGTSPATDISTTAALTVYDHSNASLSSNAIQTTQIINFGSFLKGAAPPLNRSFTLYNVAQNTSAAYTSNLKLTSFSATGDPALTTNLSTFNGLTAASGSNGMTYSASLNTANYTTTSGSNIITMSASQLADDSSLPGAGSNNDGAITVTLQGNVGNATADASNSPAAFGPALTASVAGSGSYANLESKVTATTGSGGAGMVGTTATILAGAASVSTTASMAWRTAATNPQSGVKEGFVSDVLDLTGIGVVDGQTKDGSVHTDTFVLQMDYDPLAVTARTGLAEQAAAAAGLIQMDYLDMGPDGIAGTADDHWERAVVGNFGSSNDHFVGVEPWNNDMNLGDWGVNTSNHTVWAVLDHNSQFAVTPEPSTLPLLAAGAVGLAGYVWRQRKRKRPLSLTAEPTLAGHDEADSQDDGPAILSMPSRWTKSARRAA